MSGKIRILTIGHSYVIALNRSIVREVARHPDFDVTVAAPSFFHGDLRDLAVEPEPEGSPLRLVSLDARWSRWIATTSTTADFHRTRAAGSSSSRRPTSASCRGCSIASTDRCSTPAVPATPWRSR